jgi:hypothetical protein
MGSPQVCKIVAHKTECKDPNGTTSGSLACFFMKATTEKHHSSSTNPKT